MKYANLLGLISLFSNGFSLLCANSYSPEKFPAIHMSFVKTEWEVNHKLFSLHVIPKCGTHFMQKIVYLMTKKNTINKNLSLEKLEAACLNNQIVRTFQPYSKELADLLKNQRHQLISVVRDPRDALISHVFYMRGFATENLEDKRKRDFFTVGENFDNLSLEEQITALIKGEKGCMSYIQFYKSRIGWALNPFHLMIKYEDLLGSEAGGNDRKQRATILKIARFINLSLSEEKLESILNNMYENQLDQTTDDGRVFERATKGNWKTFLTEEHKKAIKQKIGKEIIELGYANDFSW